MTALTYEETLQVSGLPSSVRINSVKLSQHMSSVSNSSVSVACEEEKEKRVED